MKIQVLGTGCPKCDRLYRNAVEAAKTLPGECEVEKVREIEIIASMGVSVTPAMEKGSAGRIEGKRLTSEPRRMRTPARSICPTATVARMRVTTGALISGR